MPSNANIFTASKIAKTIVTKLAETISINNGYTVHATSAD